MIMQVRCVVLLLAFSGMVHAQGNTIEEQIAAIKEQIKEQETMQEQLKADIASKDEEVNRLKEQLKALEEQMGGS